jgi:hypothetical protein
MQSTINIAIGYSVVPKDSDSKKKPSLSPYVSDVLDIHMVVPLLEKAVTYRSSSRGEGSGKPSVCGAAASFIKKHSCDVGLTPTFVGFDVEQFLRFVGFECGLSHTFFPPEYWLNTDRAVELNDYLLCGGDAASRATALSYFSGGFSGEDLERYTDLVKGWSAHKDAERDAHLAFLFGSIFWLWGNP